MKGLFSRWLLYITGTWVLDFGKRPHFLLIWVPLTLLKYPHNMAPGFHKEWVIWERNGCGKGKESKREMECVPGRSCPFMIYPQKQVTKSGPHSRGVEFSSTFWREEYQRIWRHILKLPHYTLWWQIIYELSNSSQIENIFSPPTTTSKSHPFIA